jgi:hypothetical protein
MALVDQCVKRVLLFRASQSQFRGTRGKHVHLCPADDEPKILEEPADLW